MSIIKETIKLNINNTGSTIIFGLGGNNHFSGYQNEINDLTEETKIELTNNIIDYEVTRFQYGGNLVNLNFYLTTGLTYYNSFIDGAGFSRNEVDSRNLKLHNSFFIMDFYDSYDNNTQTKIFTIYQTQILNGNEFDNIQIPSYRIYHDSINQFYSWYLPKSFIAEQTGSTITGYVKFSFYNAKYGSLALFYNKDNQSNTTPEKIYFKVKLDLSSLTWEFDYSGINFPPDVTAYQLPLNNLYSQKVNDGIQNFDNKQQVHPSGNTFQVSGGTYTIL